MASMTKSRRILTGVAAVAVAVGVLAFDCSWSQAAKRTSTARKKKAKIRENSFYYSAFNRRDPFASLIVGEFVSERKMSPVELGRVELVGVVKGELDRFALLEDDKGFSYILRVGDRVRNGSVIAIGDESMVARVSNFGQTRKLTLRMAKRREGDKK